MCAQGKGRCGWDGDGHQLTAAPGLRHFQGIACVGKIVMLFVEFKERKTIFRAGILEEEISMRVGLDTLFGQATACSYRSTLGVWSMHWCTDEGVGIHTLWARENRCMKHRREIKGFSTIS